MANRRERERMIAVALSRRKHGFDSRWARQLDQCLVARNSLPGRCVPNLCPISVAGLRVDRNSADPYGGLGDLSGASLTIRCNRSGSSQRIQRAIACATTIEVDEFVEGMAPSGCYAGPNSFGPADPHRTRLKPTSAAIVSIAARGDVFVGSTANRMVAGSSPARGAKITTVQD
jgi:hypothetical protein